MCNNKNVSKRKENEMNGMNYKLETLTYTLKGYLFNCGVDIIEDNLNIIEDEQKQANICFYDYENDFICNIVITEGNVTDTSDFEKNGKFYYNVKNIKFDTKDAEDLIKVGIKVIYKSKILNKFCK